MNIKALSVSQLNNYIKKVMDNDFILKNASIKGEISNFKLHSSGHAYFSLKDEYSKINCIMFKSYVKNLKFIPQNGDNVTINGRVSVYNKEGTYQFYCEGIKKEGIGDLFIAFEELKNKLYAEGLFEDNNKKYIPKYAKKIGVVTSPTGAAIRDIINVATRRNKGIDILIYPSLVQGDNASLNIIDGIKYFNTREDIDIIIIARGGGSIEELWAFNDERLAYAIYNSRKPIISGVGHETDFTIADFVSDRRAPTPSAAAEIAVCKLEEVNNTIYNYKSKLQSLVENNISFKYSYLNSLIKDLKLNSPENYIANQYVKIDSLKERLLNKTLYKIDIEKNNLVKINSLLTSSNPLNILNKGFSIVQDENNNVITEGRQLNNDDVIKVTLKKGKIKMRINDIINID